MWRFVLRENISHLQALLRSASSEDERARLSAALRSAEQELLDLEEASAHARAAQDRKLASALTLLLRDLVKRTRADFGDIQFYEPESGRLHIAAQINFRKAFLDHFAEVTADDGSVCGRALATRAGVWVENVEAEAFFTRHLAIARENEISAVKSLPLVRDGGQLLGMLSLHYHQRQHWTGQDRADDEILAAGLTAEIVALRPDGF